MVAVSQNCMVPRHIVEGGKLEAELSLMREHGLTSLQDGNLYLTSFALATTLVLSRPVSVDVDARETALELREALLERGWATSDVAGSCAVRDKKMMRVQHAEYYSLLLNYERQILLLAEQNSFSHNQKKLYYAALLLICQCEPFAP